MTRQELRQVASLAANAGFVRYWYEFRSENEQNIMAIAFMDWGGTPAKIYEPDLIRRGFRREDNTLPIPVYLVAESPETPSV